MCLIRDFKIKDLWILGLMLSSYHKIADGMTKLLIDKKSISGVIIFCSDGKHLQLPCWRSFVFYTSVQARVSRSVERMHIYTQNYSSWLASPTTQVSCRKLKTEIIILNLSALEWNRSAYLSTIEWVIAHSTLLFPGLRFPLAAAYNSSFKQPEKNWIIVITL